MEQFDEIGQMLVPGALDDTKKMRKAGADMFAKSGPKNLEQKTETSSGFVLMLLSFLRIERKIP